MIAIEDVLKMKRPALMEALQFGHPIEPASLDNVEYRGISLGLPEIVERMTWKKFKKVFHRDPVTGRLRGWNVRIVQDGLDAPWTPKMRGDRPVTFGHFEVVRPAEGEMPIPCRGLLLDYGRGKNGRLDPIRRLRDPLVSMVAGSDELLLGWSYLDLGFTWVKTPSFFALVRDVALTHVV